MVGVRGSIDMFVAAQAAQAEVLEPDKCEDWIWVPWRDIPQPIFLPLLLLQNSGYQPLPRIEGGAQCQAVR